MQFQNGSILALSKAGVMRCAGGPSRIWANTCSRRSCVGRQSIAGLISHTSPDPGACSVLQVPVPGGRACGCWLLLRIRSAAQSGVARACNARISAQHRGLMDCCCCAKMALRDLRGTAPGTAQRFLDCANYGRGGENVQQPAGALPVLCCSCPRSSKHAPKTQSDWAMAPSE